jgi:hypothetical protein
LKKKNQKNFYELSVGGRGRIPWKDSQKFVAEAATAAAARPGIFLKKATSYCFL